MTTQEASDILARAAIYLHESTHDMDKDRRSRWQAEHICLVASIGMAWHPRSYAGIQFDEAGIAKWRTR